MLACGTTTAEIKTGYGLNADSELKMLDVIAKLDKKHAIDIVPTFLAAHAIPTEYKNDAQGYVDLVCNEMLPRAWSWYERSHFYKKVPFFIDVFCEKNAFDLEQSKTILELAQNLGFRIKAHVDEFSNLGGSRMAIAMRATSIDHLDAISDDEIKLLAASDTVAIITPTVNFSLGSTHFADARKLIDEGCAVALSTDHNPGSAPCPSQSMAMAIACRYQKLLPAEAFIATTINAAYAIGRGSEVGSIESGKQADLLILDCVDFRDVAYEFGAVNLTAVIKAGKLIEL
jgi:imidazolonepropionase